MDNPGLIFATLVGVFLVCIYFREKREEQMILKTERERMKRINENEENKAPLEAKPKTKDLVYRVLKEIGCHPEEAEDDRIVFDYQGIKFVMETVNECLFVNLIWPWCHSFSKFDIDELSRVRNIINDMNVRGTVSVFYSITESDDVAVHIKKNFILVPQIPDLEDYLKSILNSFFMTARTFDCEIERVRMQESI